MESVLETIDCDESSYTNTYGKFIAEPFERGYGVTLGNSLRRILLSSIEGRPELRDDFMNLQGEQLREILRKSGEDMTHIQSVGRSAGKSGGIGGGKIVDPNNITRQEAFEMLFEKGYTPDQILKEAPPRSKPAPHRTAFGSTVQRAMDEIKK